MSTGECGFHGHPCLRFLVCPRLAKMVCMLPTYPVYGMRGPERDSCVRRRFAVVEPKPKLRVPDYVMKSRTVHPFSSMSQTFLSVPRPSLGVSVSFNVDSDEENVSRCMLFFLRHYVSGTFMAPFMPRKVTPTRMAVHVDLCLPRVWRSTLRPNIFIRCSNRNGQDTS